MDTVTHALLGATLACAAAPRRLPVRERLALGAAAGAFPDVDFAAFPIDPLRFLADWHQGPTHSLVLLPLWAGAICGAWAAAKGHREGFAAAFVACALALASHAASDAITAYGTAVFYPLSQRRFALGTTFVVDPVVGLIAIAALLGARPRRAAAGLGALVLYVGAQAALQSQALAIGAAAARAQGLTLKDVVALAQPLSPFNWKLIGTAGDDHYEAYLNVIGHGPLLPAWLPRLGELAAAYRPPERLAWRHRPRYGGQAETRALVRERWEDPRLAAFHRFAAYPALSRIDVAGSQTCVWFTDLRYDLPALPDTFRYGFCRADTASPWQPYRLRYFSERRQRL